MVKQQKIGKNYDIIKLSVQEGIEIADALPMLLKTVDACFKQYSYKIILDMQRIKFPSSSFIAFLIEITARARRAGGDIKLINLAPSATNNLVTFSPLSYLAVEGEESIALEDLDVLVINRPEIPVPEEKARPEAPDKPQPPVAEPPKTLETESAIQIDPPNLSQTVGTQKSNPAPEFKIKEVKLEIPALPVPTPEPRFQTEFSGQKTENFADLEAPRTKEVVIQPPKEMKPPQKTGQTGEATHHLKRATEDASAKSSLPESARKAEIPTVKRIRVKSQVESLYDITDFVTELAAKVGFSEKEVGKIKVTVYEACINVIEHAYHSDPDEWIVTTVQYTSEDFTIIIQDWGESFNFDDSKPYDVNKAVHDRKTGGFGLFIILRSMDEVKYKTDPVNGNRLILRKKIPQKS